MGLRMLVLVLSLVLVVAVMPANATSHPHITDPCGSVAATREAVRPEHDICGVWLSTLSNPRAEEPVRIQARIRLAGSVEDRGPSGYYLAWEAGGCELIFIAEDPNGPTIDEQRSVLVDCPGASRRTIALSGDALAVEAAGRDVVFTLTFVAELEMVAEDHHHGDTVVEPWAGAGGLIGPYPIGFYGWDDEVGTFSVNYDRTENGTPFLIGD